MPRERLRKDLRRHKIYTSGLLILGTETPSHNNQKHKNNNENQQTLRKKEILISRVTTLLDSDVQCSTENHKSDKNEPFKEKNKSTETVPKRDLMADLLDKGCKTAVLKMLKERKTWRKKRKPRVNKIETSVRK